MSDFGSIEDALISLAEGAVAGLVGERGSRLATKLNPSEFPRLFVPVTTEDSDRLEFRQEDLGYRVSLTLVTFDETREATALKSDAIRDAVNGDPTLGGLVRDCYVLRRALVSDSRSKLAAAELVVAVADRRVL